MQITVEANPSEEDVQHVWDGLVAFNLQHAKADNLQLLRIFLRDESGTIKGGLLGEIFWNWCHIAILWLDDSIRGEGYGSQILHLAEQEALARGCIGMYVDSMSFQAPDFYRKRGYTQWGQLNDFPPGHQRIFFQKSLIDTKDSE
jgi:GNAT superfamily N-acetyltransferase